MVTSASAAHLILISADCHAGGSHEQYREYLDPAYREEFDAWRGQYKNPWKDLRDTDLRVRNWDDERRSADELADGVVGEVVYPNTVPPFFPGFVLFAAPPKPEDYEHRLAGIRAHNRWLVDFCARHPAQRAGVGQIFINEIDDAIADATWIKEQGLRGGVLLPVVPPDVTWVRPLYDPEYDRLWAALQDLDIPVNVHAGTGSPNYGRYQATPMLMIAEVAFYGMRPLVHLILSGVFERFPRLKFAFTEGGASWLPETLQRLDYVITSVQKGSIGELKYTADQALPRTATEYFHQNVWMGVSSPKPADMDVRNMIAPDRFMWGSDYPHDEGTQPYTREHLRQVTQDVPEDDLRRILGLNAATLYDFDLEALAPLADRYGPALEEVRQPLLELPEQPNRALLFGQARSLSTATPA